MTKLESNEKPGILILDIPVIHKGYLELLRKHSDGSVKTLYLLGEDVLASLEVAKEMRAVDPETTMALLGGLKLPFDTHILHLDAIKSLPHTGVMTARDEVSRKLQEKFFPDATLTQERAFLRWDASNVTSARPGQFDQETSEPFHLQMMKRARELADNSSDWWRQVGVVIARDKQTLVEAYNRGFPSENSPYIDGNPRDHIAAGTLGFLSGTLHAEQAAIAKARGVSLVGADLYLNSFPCHGCASMMGVAGISRCFFTGGNAYLNVEETLHAAGVETIFVREPQPIGK